MTIWTKNSTLTRKLLPRNNTHTHTHTHTHTINLKAIYQTFEILITVWFSYTGFLHIKAIYLRMCHCICLYFNKSALSG